MLSKKLLNQYRQFERDINCKLMELKLLLEMNGRLGDVFCSQDRIMRQQEAVERDIEALFDAREYICRYIDRLDSCVLLRLLKLRYIHGLNWDQIGEAMSYSTSQIHRLHKKALQSLDSIR